VWTGQKRVVDKISRWADPRGVADLDRLDRSRAVDEHEPLSNDAAAALCREIQNDGEVEYHPHALKAAQDDGLVTADLENVLRAGFVDQSEEHGKPFRHWRYRMRTQRMAVVVVFQRWDSLLVVTTWRF
jgi:hypothetical protein